MVFNPAASSLKAQNPDPVVKLSKLPSHPVPLTNVLAVDCPINFVIPLFCIASGSWLWVEGVSSSAFAGFLPGPFALPLF